MVVQSRVLGDERGKIGLTSNVFGCSWQFLAMIGDISVPFTAFQCLLQRVPDRRLNFAFEPHNRNQMTQEEAQAHEGQIVWGKTVYRVNERVVPKWSPWLLESLSNETGTFVYRFEDGYELRLNGHISGWMTRETASLDISFAH